MGVKLSGRLPDVERNGLDLLQGDLVRHPESRHLVVAVIDCARTTVDHGEDGDIYTPTAGVLFVEPVRDTDDVNTVLDVLGRLRAERVDGGTLDFDFGVGDPLRDATADLRDTVKKMNDDGITVSFDLKHGRGSFVGDEAVDA
jgi:hypothetical protein